MVQLYNNNKVTVGIKTLKNVIIIIKITLEIAKISVVRVPVLSYVRLWVKKYEN